MATTPPPPPQQPPQNKPVTIKTLPPRFVAKNPLEYYVLELVGCVIFFLGACGFFVIAEVKSEVTIAVLIPVLIPSSVAVVVAFLFFGFATLIRSTYRSEQYLQHISDRLR